jgi:hypothetical protein
MKKNRSIWYVLFPVAITLSLYLVFSSDIETKPGDAGFWLIIALGMSIGAALTRIIQSNVKNKDE